jgi:hypothetical protein
LSPNSTDQRGYVTIEALIGRLLLYGALLVSIGVVVVSACGPERVVLPRSSPSPTVLTSAAPTTAAPTATRTVTPVPLTPVPTTAAPSPAATLAPGSTPAAACAERTGGATTNQAQLTAIRIAHNPGFDRLVFEFGPSTVPGGVYGMPPFRVAVATSLTGPSGQPVPIEGNALFGVRFQNASTVDPNGARTYTGPTSLKPTTPLIKEVRLVEDFERVLVWGVGLQRLQCPTLLTLSAPVRLVLDFPTPP